MISFKDYHHTPVKVKALHYTGSMTDAEELEAVYKSRVRLVFRGCFTGNLLIENLGKPRQTLTPGDYLVDSPDFGLFVLSPELFHKYYEALK
ncbi:MAG: hypothetical protein AB7V08_08725 [Elusimicrobiales bacterium]